MAYRYRSRRAVKRFARKSRRNFIITLIIVILLAYFTLTWILPAFINSLGFIKNIVQPSEKKSVQTSQDSVLAPPVLSIPYEATNSAQIDIKGFGTPDSKVKLYIDDESTQTVDVPSDGSFTFEKVDLNLGTNNIYGKTLDEKENESLPSKTIKLIFDNEKPPSTISEPEDGKNIQGGDKKVKVSGKTEVGVKIFINDNQVIVDKDGNFSSEQLLNDGENTVTVKAVDSASNTNEIQRVVTYTP